MGRRLLCIGRCLAMPPCCTRDDRSGVGAGGLRLDGTGSLDGAVRVYDVRVAADAAAGIAFQESEVAGGRFEARAAVDAAAEESWRRDILQQQQRQPAAVGDDGHDDEEEEPRIFVPDGLAVWNAYLEWERERKGC